MSEIKTNPVRAQHIADKEAFRVGGVGQVPGSFRVDEPDDDGERYFWFCCPCGCGDISSLTVGEGFKPADPPSWTWNGSFNSPELQPSVHRVGHWHGWLRAGVWTSC
jgi:hypothetical protein